MENVQYENATEEGDSHGGRTTLARRESAEGHVAAKRHRRVSNLAVAGLVLSVVLYRFSYTMADPDLWGHLTFGNLVWRSGAVALPDPFSYMTAGSRWVNHEWLFEVLLHLLFVLAGPTGLIVVKLAVSLGMFGLLYHHLRLQGMTTLRVCIVLLLVLHAFLPSLILVRPQTASFLLFLLTLLIIHAVSRGRVGWAWAAPPLFALWANLHGGFLAGLGVLVIWAAAMLGARWASGRTRAPQPTALAVLALLGSSLLATALNPYGIELWRFLVRTAFGTRPEITEWQPLALTTPYGLGYAALVALGAWGVLNSSRERKPALMAVLVVTVLLPLTAIRHTPLAALAVAVLAGEHINDAWERWSPSRSSRQDSARSPWDVRLSAVALVGAAVLVALSVPHLSCIRVDPAQGLGYPARAIGLIKRSGATGNLAITFGWGEYAIYHIGPAIRVSIDGRRETVYPPQAYLESMRFLAGQGDWDALLRSHRTDLALVPVGSAAFNLLKLEPGWQLLYEDALAGLFGHAGASASDAVGRTKPPDLPADGSGLCFP
jgi:hypothetical protein